MSSIGFVLFCFVLFTSLALTVMALCFKKKGRSSKDSIELTLSCSATSNPDDDYIQLW
jgi:hypothetical protein